MGQEIKNGCATVSENRTGQSLRASEVSYRRLFEAARDGILILDADTGRITDVNPFLVELLGFSFDEMVGHTVGELSPFKDIESNQIMLERLQKNGYVRYENLPLEAKDGRHVAVEFVSNVYEADGIKVVQCNVRDITERRRIEQSLRLLDLAVSVSQESIVITDAELLSSGPKIIFVNPAFTRMTGYTAAEVMGRSPVFLHGPRTDKSVLRRLRQNLERGESFAGEAINYRKDGTEFDMEWQIAPIRDAGGTITHFVANQHDITERRKLESQLRQSQKMEAIGTLAGGVAHDFNNILAVIQLQLDLFKGASQLLPEQLESAEQIAVATQRAAALTRQLLLFSRKEALQTSVFDLNESILDLTKMLQRILGEDIQMQLKFFTQPLFIRADASMMQQVLMNLVVNSRDAMPGGGQLVIKTSAVEFDESVCAQSPQARPGSFACLSISDNGCGIPPENLARIFEPFFTTKGVGKGTGLGLATLFGIVQQHHGWVSVYSEAGQGATFRIYLPRLPEPTLFPPKHGVAKPPTQPGGKETILFVEDDPFLRPSLAKILSQLGYRVLAAGNGAEALDVWKQNRAEIQLLLTDLVMPGGMSGKDLGQRLLAEQPRLKVIYASGYSAEIVGKDFPLQEGVNFLVKPFPTHKLAQIIRQSLDAPA